MQNNINSHLTDHFRFDISYLPKNRYSLFVFILVLWNAQILSGTSTNPLGISGAQELFLVFLAAFSLFYIFQQFMSETRILKADAIVLTLIMGAYIYSAIAANFSFNQPVIYGLIEERRIFAFLIYFPIVWALRKNIVTVKQLLHWIVLSAVICALLSILFYLGIFTSLNDRQASELLIRSERYGIGQSTLAVATLIAVNRITIHRLLSGLLLIALFIGVLLVIVQTRQILIALLIALIFLKGPIKFFLWAIPPILLTIILYLYINPVTILFDRYFVLFNELLSESYATESARSLTIQTILKNLFDGAWLGSGALSTFFQGGFTSIYHSNFYLTDVGIFGSIYKFGLLTVLIYGTYLLLQGVSLFKASQHTYARLLFSIWILLLVILPVAATIEYRGYVSGLLLAITMGCIQECKQAISAHN